MKLDEIRRMARENEVVAYFKALYRHSVQLLESIPDDEMRDILSKNRNGRYVTEEDHRIFPNRKDEDYPYEFGVLDSFRFGNPNDDYDMKDKKNVFAEAELIGTYEGKEYYDVVACRCFESTFDYRFMYMTLYLGKKEVYFEVVNSNYDDELSDEDKAFLKTLKSNGFLERIFGEYLIHDCNEGFVVSEKFFED
ncbi:MAG: hypothetical protein IKF38_04710 [Clostridia bacterium]|nr:hypothetical protein [Clostridia bacterium]